MIFFRRFIAIPLALVFIILFIVLLVVNRANATAGNPDFYIERLHEADIYNFMYDDIMPAALDELEADMDDPDMAVDLTLLKSKLPGMMEAALPPEWLEAQVAGAIDQIVPYVMGDTDNFTIAIALDDRVAAVAAVLKDSLHDEAFFNDLYEQGIDFALDEYAEIQADLPEALRLSDAEVDGALREVLPPDWIHAQVDAAIDAVVPYLTKEAEHFTVRLDVSGRMAALEDVITGILLRPETYDYVVNDMAVSYLRDKINEIDIPDEIVIYDSDIRGVIDEVLPAGWYEARVNEVVGQVFSYLRGDRDTIDISVYLGDLKAAAIDALTEMADQKLEAVFNSLPFGTAEQTAELLANPPSGSLPDYRPADMTYAGMKDLVDIDIESIVSSSINDLPDEYTFSDADIREALGSTGDDDMLTTARDFVRDGVTFTDADLYEEFGEQRENIDDVRDWVAADFLFTEQDLHDYMVEDGNGMAEDNWQTVENVRDIVGTARTWLWPAWIVPALILVSIGFLGGRQWYSRIIWAASVLAVAALIVYIAFGPLFSALARPEIDKAIAEAVGENQGIGAIAADKAVTVARDTVDSVIGGTGTLAIVLLAASLAVIAAAVFWHFWRRRSQAMPVEIPPDVAPPPESPPDTPYQPTG